MYALDLTTEVLDWRSSNLDRLRIGKCVACMYKNVDAHEYEQMCNTHGGFGLTLKVGS